MFLHMHPTIRQWLSIFDVNSVQVSPHLYTLALATFVFYAENGINLSSKEHRFLFDVRISPGKGNKGFFYIQATDSFFGCPK